jgi:cell wall-associated NlpC family hydrolase
MNFSAFVGIPYRDKGRDLSGCDCWGLVWMVYRDLLGVELPSYTDRYTTGADRQAMNELIRGELGAWSAVPAAEARALDGVLIREGRFERHIGLVTSPGRLLHVGSGTATSRIERYDEGMMRHRVAGFFRHQAAVGAT